MTFPIPAAALSNHIAILGKTGSGKTSTAKLIDILEAARAPMSREDLATAVGLEATGGTFATYLSRLKSNGVVEKSERGFALAEVLR